MPSIKLRIPSNRTLGNICVYGAVVSISAVMYMRWRLQDRVRSTEYYKLAMQTLRQHKGAVGILGEPIRESGFDMANVNNTCDANKAQLEVTVRGPKDKGTLFFWATNNLDQGWLIDRLELEAKQHPNKRFLLKKSDEQTLIDSLTQSQQHQEEQQRYMEQERQYLERQEKQRKSSEEHDEEFHYSSRKQPQPLHEAEEPTPYIQTADGGRMR
ncbi:uncharacterized protein LOC117785744 [Drosophila innubila]|uniref:uncharacterized protein LOC117785744 n=1 Tax=Drosophila innubila TaxID=198719 RepID=UPI00148B8C4E|nr:uncharacterized protein LOC117785744 [Drosophila innubila]